MADKPYGWKDRLKNFFWNTDIRSLTLIPAAIGFLLFVLPVVLSKAVFSEPISEGNFMMFLMLSCFMFGSIGVIEIIRKESSSIFGITKITSIISGILTIILLWGSAFVLLLMIINKVFQ